jgi:hypothetical protein
MYSAAAAAVIAVRPNAHSEDERVPENDLSSGKSTAELRPRFKRVRSCILPTVVYRMQPLGRTSIGTYCGVSLDLNGRLSSGFSVSLPPPSWEFS